MRQGLIIVHTGEGKGKTTAALGLAVRAWGAGLKVLILQFIKGGASPGELKAIETLQNAGGRIRLEQMGKGFTSKGDREEHQTLAKEAIIRAKEAFSEAWDMVILDEINYAVKFGLISESDLMNLIDARPPNVHLVLTGRDALPSLIEGADLVTDMQQVKHPYQKGIKAQAGIEF